MKVFSFSRLPGKLIVAESYVQAIRIAMEAQAKAGLHAPSYLGDYFCANTSEPGVVEVHRP